VNNHGVYGVKPEMKWCAPRNSKSTGEGPGWMVNELFHQPYHLFLLECGRGNT
jgi:hypothetical protein